MSATSGNVPPRIYGLLATEAPVVAVFRRGPTRWSHVGRWDLEAGRYEPGAWLAGRIFPRRSDVSPDGKYLCCFAHKPTAKWELGDAYVAVSRLPWLTALHTCGTCGTWTRGYYFSGESSESSSSERSESSEPDSPEPGADELPIPWRLRSIPVVQFANERRRGWVEADDSPPHDPRDAWDERRNARMRKRQPGGDRILCVESVGRAGGEFGVEQAVDGLRVAWSLEDRGEIRLLDDIQWADWDRDGRLLVATRAGSLQIRSFEGDTSRVLFEHDLSALEPSSPPPPDWATRW